MGWGAEGVAGAKGVVAKGERLTRQGARGAESAEGAFVT